MENIILHVKLFRIASDDVDHEFHMEFSLFLFYDFYDLYFSF